MYKLKLHEKILIFLNKKIVNKKSFNVLISFCQKFLFVQKLFLDTKDSWFSNIYILF